MSKLERPFKFEWKSVPRINDRHLMPLCVFSTGTIRGAYDSKDVVEIAERICKFLNAKEENQNSALAELHEWFVNNGSGIDWREQDKFEEIYKRLAACPNGENNNESQPSLSCKGCKRRGDELEGECLNCRRFNGVRIDW